MSKELDLEYLVVMQHIKRVQNELNSFTKSELEIRWYSSPANRVRNEMRGYIRRKQEIESQISKERNMK